MKNEISKIVGELYEKFKNNPELEKDSLLYFKYLILENIKEEDVGELKKIISENDIEKLLVFGIKKIDNIGEKIKDYINNY